VEVATFFGVSFFLRPIFLLLGLATWLLLYSFSDAITVALFVASVVASAVALAVASAVASAGPW